MFLKNRSPIQISLGLHFLVVLSVFILNLDLLHFRKNINVHIDIIRNPVVIPAQLNLQPRHERPNPAPPKNEEPVKKVFGLSRKAITDSASSGSSVSVKQGNTVAKEMDNLKLDKDDSDSIPIPADDYLVTSGAKLLSQVVANRTEEARKAGYTGTAILLIIIDKQGVVKKAELLNSLDYGLNEKALEIVKTLKFSPAKIKDEAVATQIRFSINFKSTN